MLPWRTTPQAETLGTVEAHSADEAIAKAAEAWGITDPERRERLAASRIEED